MVSICGLPLIRFGSVYYSGGCNSDGRKIWTLDQIANIVEILGVLALISAIIFAWIQIRQHRNDTRNAALIALTSSSGHSDTALGQ